MNNRISSWTRVTGIMLLAVTMTACNSGSRKAKKDQVKYEIRKVEPETRHVAKCTANVLFPVYADPYRTTTESMGMMP